MAIVSVKKGNKPVSKIKFQIKDKKLIKTMIQTIDFKNPVDGFGLLADSNAYVFFKLKGGFIPKYELLLEYEYIMREGDWNHMFAVSLEGQELFRKHTQ